MSDSPPTLFDRLHEAFHRSSSPLYRVVDRVVWAVIGLSLAVIAYELIAFGADDVPPFWLAVDGVILGFFGLELVLRVVSVRPASLELFEGDAAWVTREHIAARVRYLLHPLTLIDLLAILALVPALRGLRALRLLRLLRGVKFFRYSSPLQSLLRAFQENAFLYAVTFSFVLTVVVLGGTSVTLIERATNPDIHTLSDGIWWALVTLTTVGFGDITPVTTLGRIVGGVLMIVGMFTLALFAGVVGTTLLRSLLSLREDQFRMSSYTNHIVVCGYEPSANLLLEAVKAETNIRTSPVLVFAQGERPMDLPPEFIWINGDATREAELDKVHLTRARAVLLVGSRSVTPQQADARTVLVSFTIRAWLKKHPAAHVRRRPLYVVAEILDPENATHARAAGADEVIESTRLGFSLMAHAAMVPGSGAIMSSVASAGSHSLFIEPNPVDAVMAWGELLHHLRESLGVVPLGFRSTVDRSVHINPSDDEPVSPDAEIVYLAAAPVLTRMERAVLPRMGREEGDAIDPADIAPPADPTPTS